MGIWTPEAQWVGPSPNQSGPMTKQRGMILHVMQGSLAGSIQWGKNPDSNVSFHFGTRKSDGLAQQLVDTSITAWTQCGGNGEWVSVENEDYNTNPLSSAQVETNARLYARGVREYGWPLQITDDPNGRGLGWHGMGGADWCSHPYCPGEPIKAQRPAIIARAQQILNGEGDDMTPEEHQMLKDIHYLFFDLDSAPRPEMSVAGKIETIRAAVTSGVPIPGEVTVSAESVIEIAKAVADEEHARSAE